MAITLSRYGVQSNDAALVITQLAPGQLVEGDDGELYEYSNVARENASTYAMQAAGGGTAYDRNGAPYLFIQPYEFFRKVARVA